MINQTYETNSCILYQNDCFEVMKIIKDNSIDLIITAPLWYKSDTSKR